MNRTSSINGTTRKRLTSVIVVTYNSRNCIRGTLESLRQAYDQGLVKCIVVDNASRDGTADVVAVEYPWVELVRSPVNLGYARGLNLGLQSVQTPYVLFSNADARLSPAGLATLVSFLESHPDAGMAAPALVGPNNERARAGGLPTPWGEIARAAGRMGGARGKREVVPGAAAFPADWLCGAIFLARTALMDRLGGLDPRFFLYFEETDLCRRVLQCGMTLWAVGEVVAHHEIASSAKQTKAPLLGDCIAEHFFRSRFYYFVKHHGWIPAICGELGELVVLLALAVPRRLKHGNWGQLGARLRAPILRLPPRQTGLRAAQGRPSRIAEAVKASAAEVAA
jgi:N-acetylglucosaminyl-diphospho-decaprenol L-rhamnosyltransferase